MEKSWELLRICRTFIKENSKTWQDDDTNREKERQKEEKKRERLNKVAEKKETLKQNLLQRKITDSLKKLPPKEREKYGRDEERKRKIELKEVKENIWKKWRNPAGKEQHAKQQLEKNENIENLESKLSRIDEIIEKVKQEENERKERQAKENERRRRKMKEMEKEHAQRVRREEEKMQRKEKKRLLEEKWAMVKWLTEYIEKKTGEKE